MNRSRHSGFTLLELVMVIVVLGIMAAVAVPRLSGITDEAKRSATLKEMNALREAIAGNPSGISGGHAVLGGYEGDVGALPSSLQDLVTKPGGVASWDRYTQTGWDGPYVDSGGGYSTDAWGNAYQYNSGARTITSTAGGGTQIVVYF
ncbi:MAG: prepilin-type N-terminal cleavage/methylation domain-containing protein [Candidatus Eisenbacteria sp.]|nr:prepilin-type N-terminal cleavage/methylation domain-containing protein [Candidatus Eisenbacteria bacterium]